MKTQIRIILLSSIILPLLFSSCISDEITVGDPQDLRIEELSMNGIKLIVFLPINNPNQISFNLLSADIDVYLNNRKLGKVNSLDRIKIPRVSHEIYPVFFEIEPSKAAQNIFTIIRDFQMGSPKLAFKGNIRVSKFLIFKNIDVDHEQVFYIN